VTWGHFVEKTTQYDFYAYNTHFDHASQSSREKSAILLMDKIQARSPKAPFMVTGDLNAGESNVVVRFLKGKIDIGGQQNPLPMFDSFRTLHPTATNVGTAHGFTGKTDGNKIDYVFMGNAQQEALTAWIDHYNVNGRYPSDHFPVVGAIKLP
jgi:endonuclease/exonuclease/phosphatase family metal-dependent hydrolase